jgi:hypothetical protein
MTTPTETAPTETSPFETSASTSPKVRRLDSIRRTIRGFLIVWRTIIVFILLSLLGGIVVIPLVRTPDHYLDGVQELFAGLIAQF